MSAYTINQLRANAPAEFKNLDDEDLVREYARVKQIPFEQAADYYGVKPRGTLGEMGRQAAGGAMVDLPRMVGQGLKATGLAPEYGQELVQAAEERAYRYDPDQRAERGLVGQALTLGSRALAPMAPSLGAMFLPGGQVIAPTVAAGLFGTSAYQDTYEKILEQTGDEEAAKAAGLRSGAIQGPLEGIATATGMRAIRPIAAAVRGAPTTGRVAQAMTDTGVLRPVARGMAINLAVQPATEVIQDVGTELVERAYGAAPEDLGEIAKQSALGGAGLSILLGPLSIGGSIQRSRNAQRLKEALDPNADVDPAFRAQALDVVMAEARRQNVAEQDVGQWFDRQLLAEDMRTELLRMEEEKRQRQNRESDLLERAGLEGIVTQPDPLQQRIDESLGVDRPEGEEDYADAFTQAYNTPSGLFVLEEPGQPPRELTNGELIELRASGQDVQILTPDQVGRPVTGELTPLQRLALQGPTAPRPVTGGLTELQRLSAIGPIGEGMTPMQQAAVAGPREVPTPVTGGARALTPGQRTALIGPTTSVSSPGVSEPAGPSPAAPVAAGAFSETTGADLGTQAPQAQQTETQRQEAPAATAITEADVSPEQEAEVTKVIDEIGLRPLVGGAKENLEASVRGGTITVGGKATLNARTLAAAVNNALAGREGTGPSGKLSKAARRFAEAYRKYLDAAGNMVPTERRAVLKPTKKFPQKGDAAQADARATENVAKVRKLWQEAQSALAELGQAAGNNAKNVEVMVRLMKDRIAAEKAQVQAQRQDAETRGDEDAATDFAARERELTQLDLGLSRGWAAAKRGNLRNDADLMDVRGGETRTSTEEQRQGAEQPLVVAATQGAAVGPRSAPATGFQGVLNYIRSNGSPFERMIAKAISEVFKNTKNPPKLVFAEGTPEFNPRNNTITMSPTASIEVALHEGLHAALQWFVHNNPKNPFVVQLLRAVDKVVAFDTKKLSPKAAEVQKVLADLKKGKRDLDAVLELVSYGNTLVEFRKALEAMPTDAAPKSFIDAANDVWNMILATVRRMLGVPQSVASDVIMDSFKLLEEASRTEFKKTRKGGKLDAAVLQASVQSTSTNPATTPASTVVQDVQTQTNAQAAQEANYPSFSAYESTPASKLNVTRMLFERAGFGEGGQNSAKVRAKLNKTAQAIRENFPALERTILNINSRFGLPPGMDTIIEYFKTHQNTGILEMEKMSEAMQQDPTLAAPILDYLDGNTKAFDGRKDAATLTAIGENVRYHLQTYINSLPANSRERALFSNLKFTDYLLHPESFAQMANKSFGVKKLSTLLGMKDRREESIDVFSQFLPMKNGVVDSDAPLYQLTQVIQDNDGNNVTVPWGFISKEMADKNPPAGLDIDKSRLWKFDGMAGKQFKFISRARTGADIRTMAQEGKVEELSASLLNTMAALSHNYASRNYFRGLTTLGRGADGKPTAQSAVFDSIDQINEVFKGRALTDEKVLNASSDEAKNMAIRSAAQRTGVWVKLPEGDTYGDLAGKYVPGPVWSSMLDMHDRKPLFNSEVFNGTMRWFKKAKTIYTPATHANNILTNYSLMLLHGISHKTLRDAAVMFAKFERAPDKMNPQQRAMMQAFYRSGAVLGQYTQTEAKQVIADALIASISPSPSGSMIKRMTELAGFEKRFAQELEKAGRNARNFDSSMMNLYAAGDNIFRLAAFMNTAGNLQSRDGTAQLSDAQLTEAGIAARKMFLDYDIDARWVRAARQSFLPFVSWSYAIMPVLGRLAIDKPWAMVNMMAAIGLMSAVFDGDDNEEWRLTGPEQVREKAFWGMGPHMFMRVPFLGDDENPVYWNIGKSVPMMTLADPPMGESRLFGQSWIPGFLTPGGPYMNLIAGAFLGIDPFTGKKLSDETSDNFSRFVGAAEVIYNTMTPSIGQTRMMENAQRLIEGRVGPTGREPDALFLARLGGMTLYQFNRQETDFYNDKEIQRIKRDFGSAMATAKRNEYNKGYPDYEALDTELAKLRERMEKRIAEIRGEE
jgi:hypothetical protein